MPTHFYRPADGHSLPHDPFNAIIAPRPIGWISSLTPSGVYQTARARPAVRGRGPGDSFTITPEAQSFMPRPENWGQRHR